MLQQLFKADLTNFHQQLTQLIRQSFKSRLQGI